MSRSPSLGQGTVRVGTPRLRRRLQTNAQTVTANRMAAPRGLLASLGGGQQSIGREMTSRVSKVTTRQSVALASQEKITLTALASSTDDALCLSALPRRKRL